MLKDFGKDLRKLRESKNITIAEVSAQTRINTKHIEKLEAGIFDFQPDTYIRAFLREYARSINESEDQILIDYGRAKSGYYAKKSTKKDDLPITIKPVSDPVIEERKQTSIVTEEKIASEKSTKEKSNTKKEEQSLNHKGDSKYEDEEEYSNKTVTQKILLGLLILIILAGAYYLYMYLNESDKNQSVVKPKQFDETVEGYEQKMNGNPNDTTTVSSDLNATSNIQGDSLKLTVVAFKEVRIKVYIDEKSVVEEVIPGKDSLSILAKDQFRFSSSGNASVDLYLNGRLLKKPSYLTTGSIKNLVINKDGIVSE